MAEKVAQEIRELYQNHLGYWTPFREARRNERDFLDGDRYQDNHGAYNRDRRLIQIRGPEIQDTCRHIVAQTTAKARSVEGRPNSYQNDAVLQEAMTSLVEHELANPWKMFEDCYEECLQDAREARAGMVIMDLEPNIGPYGNEIVFRTAEVNRMMWDPAWPLHHPLNGWMLEEKRIDVEHARRVYRAEWLQPDREAYSSDGSLKVGVPIIRGADGTDLPGHYDDNKVTLWVYWKKSDQTEAVKELDGQKTELAPEDRYMSCQACGYRSLTQGELNETGASETELPPVQSGAEGCPMCAEQGIRSSLRRVDALAVDQHQPAFQNGRRLVILAPFSMSPDDQPLYDGDWPVPGARSYPVLYITSYLRSGRPMGTSDTCLMWDQQLALDELRTLAVQRIYEHRDYWILPGAGINNAEGRRFGFRDDDYNVMYRDLTQTRMGPLDVEVKSGTGLDPMFMVAFNITNQALTEYRGVADIGLTEENSKNIAEGTVAQLSQMKSVPLAHFKRRVNRALSLFYGVVSDYISAIYTPDRLARLRLDGVDVVVDGISGDCLPTLDYVVEETPEWSGLDQERAQAFDGLLGAYQKALLMQLDPIGMVEVYAELNNIPKSVLRKFMKVVQATVMKMQGGVANGAPDASGRPAGPVDAPPSSPTQPAGMAPALTGA